jgi:hypothetical protein
MEDDNSLRATSPLVLVTDDAPDIEETVGDLLRLAEFRVDVAKNGFEGFKKAVEISPDVIVMDLVMPCMGRGGNHGSSTRADEGHPDRCLELYMDDLRPRQWTRDSGRRETVAVPAFLPRPRRARHRARRRRHRTRSGHRGGECAGARWDHPGRIDATCRHDVLNRTPCERTTRAIRWRTTRWCRLVGTT